MKESTNIYQTKELYPEPITDDLYIKIKEDETLDKKDEDNSQNDS